MAGLRSPYFSRSKVNVVQKIQKRKIKIQYEEEQQQQTSKRKNNVNNKEKTSECTSWQPKNWELLFNNIKEMRKDRNAVVDSQGCERTADMWESPEVIRYQTLISLMLSSQTRDQVTFAAMKKLKIHGLTIPNIIKSSSQEIEGLIHPVGFKKRKAQYILEASQICHDKFGDDIPNTLEGLISLPGVGPKMAHICMNAAWGEVTGIGVDTHVHRIANWLKLVKEPTKTPEKTRKALESWLPKSEWKDFNLLLVGFGQQTCLPTNPKCDACLNNEICPAAFKKKKKKSS